MGAATALALVGATATGKTALAEALAPRVEAEIVCADSRQVYHELEIGTGKPSREALAARPHHLFGALVLGQRASAGWYAAAALQARERVRAGGRVPLLCGGSGLWLKAAQQGLAAEPPHDPELRRRLSAELESVGPEALHARLMTVDPATARRLDRRDGQRITRALEVWEGSGRPLSWWHEHARPEGSRERWRVVELVVSPETLRKRIASRTRWMFERGLVDETSALIGGGRGAALRALRAVGYDEAMALLEGRMDRAQAAARVDVRTAQLAKRQRTWFRHQIEAVRLDAEGTSEHALLESALAALGRGRVREPR